MPLGRPDRSIAIRALPPRAAVGLAAALNFIGASQAGFPLSTTHVTSGAVMGAGVGRRAAEVHWGIAGQMAWRGW